MLHKSTADHLAGPTDSAGLTLERLPNGEYALLRPDAGLDRAITDAERLDADLAALEQRCADLADPRYRLTDLGRDYLTRLRAWAWLGITPAEAV